MMAYKLWKNTGMSYCHYFAVHLHQRSVAKLALEQIVGVLVRTQNNQMCFPVNTKCLNGCPGEHKMVKLVSWSTQNGQHIEHIEPHDDDHANDDDNIHLINDWFEQDVELGVVGQRCVIVVCKVCWLPMSP